ncbi:MAG: hypothetical protein JO345_25625 [Streptosporangiaceae bacterium]|nr:hypothetical protein [Streptosporangiaceae bacterium]
MHNARRVAAVTVASGLFAAGAMALGTPAASASTATSYSFATLDNAHDPTFNQLLGINDHDVIAGYFGSGAAGHPNKGYLLLPDYGQGRYVNENFPGSAQTQVTGLNNSGVTVGFWSSMNNANQVNDNHGFVEFRGHFRTADFPAGSPASPPVDQLLGVNDGGIAAGFYTDANGINHGYEYNIVRNSYKSVTDPQAPGASLTAAAINGAGDVAGFYTNPASGNTDGFLLTSRHHFIDLAVPGAASTTALGVNGRDEVVGVYATAAGAMHGFTWTPEHGFSTVDDPNGAGTTTINGVNDRGQVVGFYVDGAGNTDGFLASPHQP